MVFGMQAKKTGMNGDLELSSSHSASDSVANSKKKKKPK
jgi:hypothetical protein